MAERINYPDVAGVEVLLDRRPLPREQWQRYAVRISDLLDAKSGTETRYGCNGDVCIRPVHKPYVARGEAEYRSWFPIQPRTAGVGVAQHQTFPPADADGEKS